VKLALFFLVVTLLVIVPKEYYQRRSFLVFLVVIVPTIAYIIYVGISTADETDEYIAGHRRTKITSHEDDDNE
jgi:hypothetical protein